MRAPSSAGAANPRTSARGLSHPYSPASPANGTWLFSDSSEESSSSAGDSILTDDGVHPISASFKRGSRQPPPRLSLFPSPPGLSPSTTNERGCPTVAQYLAVEASYIDDHAPARRQKALVNYESMVDIAQVLAHYNEPLAQYQDGRPLHTSIPTTGIMATSAMRHWARSKFTLAHDGVVLCKGKQVLVREQFYSALCWAHLQSGHGGRDKTSRMLWRYAGVPKELIMRFVASCPTCIDKTAAIRRAAFNTSVKVEKSGMTFYGAERSSGPSVEVPPNSQTDDLTLPPLREVLSTLFNAGNANGLQMPARVPSVLDSPTNFSPVGSAFDEVFSPPQGYVAQHEGYGGVSTTSPLDPEDAPSSTIPALRCLLSQLGSPEQASVSGSGAEVNQDGGDNSCVSDDSAFPSMLDYSSSPYAQTPARDALMFAWGTAPMQRQAATEGVGLSPPSSPLMRGYAHLASPAFEDSPSATARLLDNSPAAGGGLSGWSPSSTSSASPIAVDAPHFPSPVFNSALRLYDTPLSRFSNRTFQQRWEAMYSARNVDMSHLPPGDSSDGSRDHAIIVDDDSEVSLVDDGVQALTVNGADKSFQADSASSEAQFGDVQHATLGVAQQPVGRARAHSHSLGLALQTDFSADTAPTPPLTATSVLSLGSPTSPGLATPALSLAMQIVQATCKHDESVKGEDADQVMLPWNEGLPTEHDPLAPHNMLDDWINMDYVQTGEEHVKFGGEQGSGATTVDVDA